MELAEFSEANQTLESFMTGTSANWTKSASPLNFSRNFLNYWMRLKKSTDSGMAGVLADFHLGK